MYQAGLVLEGGGLRGVYTAGVLDAFLDAGIEFSSVYGVSAGSSQACSYLSKQRGRGFRTYADYTKDPSWSGVRSWFTTGDFFNVETCYSRIPDVLDPYDYQEFDKYEGKFYAVVTNLETGRAEYLRVRDMRKDTWKIRASSSLPLLSRTIIAHGKPYLDGGAADSIPIHKSIADGNKKNVVIVTRGPEYRKGPNRAMPAMKLRYHKYPEFLKVSEERHFQYNNTLDFLAEESEKGNIFVIRPKKKVNVDRLEKNRDKLQKLYEQGLEDGKNAIEDLKAYLEA